MTIMIKNYHNGCEDHEEQLKQSPVAHGSSLESSGK